MGHLKHIPTQEQNIPFYTVPETTEKCSRSSGYKKLPELYVIYKAPKLSREQSCWL
jgi:hypothetical protein